MNVDLLVGSEGRRQWTSRIDELAAEIPGVTVWLIGKDIDFVEESCKLVDACRIGNILDLSSKARVIAVPV